MHNFFSLLLFSVLFFEHCTLLTAGGYKGSSSDAADDSRDFEFDRVYKLIPSCGAGTDLPCPSPLNIPEDWKNGPNFDINVKLFVNEKTNYVRVLLRGKGFPTGIPVTAWATTWPPSDPAPHPILEPTVTHPSGPLTPTTAAFNNGRDPYNEPNTITVEEDGEAYYEMILNWNPLMKDQHPLINEVVFVQQSTYDDTIGDPSQGEKEFDCLQQNTYRKNGNLQIVTREYLREFNEDGSMKLDEYGRSVIPRSPVPTRLFEVVAHTDELTHGMASSLSNTKPTDADFGDHFEVVRFELDQKVDITQQYMQKKRRKNNNNRRRRRKNNNNRKKNNRRKKGRGYSPIY